MDLEGIILGVAGGAIIASLLTYYFTKKVKVEETPTLPESVKEHLLVPPEKVEEARRELKVLRMERELLNAALTKLYEAEAQGKIGREEREALVKKYKERLRELQEKISNAAALVELSELENAKEEILRLMNVKLSQIERRLEELRAKVGTVLPRPIEQKEKKPEIIEKERQKRRKKETEEDKWSKMVEEVNEALARLEQIEIE